MPVDIVHSFKTLRADTWLKLRENKMMPSVIWFKKNVDEMCSLWNHGSTVASFPQPLFVKRVPSFLSLFFLEFRIFGGLFQCIH